MRLFGLNADVVRKLEIEEQQTILTEGFFVCSSARVSSGKIFSRHERRVVEYRRSFYLLQLYHEAVMGPTGRTQVWRCPEEASFGVPPRIVEGAVAASDENPYPYTEPQVEFRGDFKPAVVEWASDSLDQFTKAEKAEVNRWRVR